MGVARRKVLVVGGARFVGPLLLELLTKSGDDVTVFNRGGHKTEYPGVRFVKGDRKEGFGMIAKDKFDLVVDMCAYHGEDMERLIAEVKFDFVVYFGSVAAYAQPVIYPINETYPLGEWFWGDYGKGKGECEKVLERSKVKYASLRPTYVLGVANYMDRENFIYKALREGRVLTIPGDGRALTQFVFADEVAKSLFLLCQKKTEGAFNCVGDDYITLTDLVEQMAMISGTKPEIQFDPSLDRGNGDEKIFPFDNENFLFDNSKIKQVIGVTFTPLLEGLKRDWEGYYKNNLK